MRVTIRSPALLSALVMLLLVASCSLTASVKAQNEIAWVYDYPTGLKIAAEKNEPVMVYIHEDWCPRCRNMDQNTWNNSEVEQLSASFVNVNVRGTEQGTLYNYSKPPLVVLTDPRGKIIVERNAELSPNEVIALQRQVLAQAPFPSPSPTGNSGSISSSTPAKATGVPGFEAMFAVASVVIAAVALSRIGQRRR